MGRGPDTELVHSLGVAYVRSSGAAGARLFPELVEVCESAARVRAEA